MPYDGHPDRTALRTASLGPMSKARRATPADANELVRLRGVMFEGLVAGEPANNGWRETSCQRLQSWLGAANLTFAAFVVDRDDRAGELAACALGSTEYRLGNPGNITGDVGYIFSVATDPDQRRRGYSRQCVTALLDWYRDRGIRAVDLRASPEGEPLYRSLGFTRTPDPAMRLHLDLTDA